MADGSRTLAVEHGTVRPAALSLERAVADQPVALGPGRWTEVTYTVTNHSHSAYPHAQAQAGSGVCAAGPDDPAAGDVCSGSGRAAATTALRTQGYDGAGWKEVSAPDDGSQPAETLTMPLGALPADSSRKFRLRCAGSEQLDGDARLLTITARVNGKDAGASERSLGIASPLTFAVR